MSDLNQHKVGSVLMDTAGKARVYIAANTEELDRSFNIAQNPIEGGSAMTDHISMDSDAGTIDGYMLGDGAGNVDAQDYVVQLIKWQNSGTPLKWYGRRYVEPILIEDFNQTYDAVANAVKVSITWKFLRITQRPQEIAIAVKKPANPPAPPKPATPPGVWVTVVAGNTYWGWMMQYGTSIDQLRAWNGWPDRFIPIGVRARVR
ncbi:MAG: phage baseplate protein [Weissella confusa]